MNQPNYEANLKQWDKIDAYSAWIYSTYSCYIGKRVLDIGVGVGNMTKFYIDRPEIVICGDIVDSQLQFVKQRFINKNVQVISFDIEKDNVDFLHEFNLDTVICINVLEHIEDDLKALKNMASVCKKYGKIIIFVPACNKIYNHMDKNGGHYRRYDRGQIESMAKKAGLKVLKQSYFNIFGIVPYVYKGWRKKSLNETFSSSLNETNSRIYNIASKVLSSIEKRVKIPIGLSEIIVLEKIS